MKLKTDQMVKTVSNAQQRNILKQTLSLEAGIKKISWREKGSVHMRDEAVRKSDITIEIMRVKKRWNRKERMIVN